MQLKKAVQDLIPLNRLREDVNDLKNFLRHREISVTSAVQSKGHTSKHNAHHGVYTQHFHKNFTS